MKRCRLKVSIIEVISKKNAMDSKSAHFSLEKLYVNASDRSA